MSGTIHKSQIDMRTPPTEDNHLVRLTDMREALDGLETQAVDVVLDVPFVGAYDPLTQTLTQTTAETVIIDDVTVAQDGRLLCTAQPDATQNGIYKLTTLGVTGTTVAVITRASDMNASASLVSGKIVPVTSGTVNAGTKWKLSPATKPAVLDGTNLIFSKVVADRKKVVELAFDLEGDGVQTTFTRNHNLDTWNVTHELIEAPPSGETVYAQFKRISANTVTVTFGEAPAVGEDHILIIRAEIEP